MSHEVRNTGKYDFHRFILHLLHEEAQLNNHSSTRLEILHVNRFSSELVHRHIIFPLTPLLLEKLMIIGPDNTL